MEDARERGYFFAPYANQVGVLFFVAIVSLMILNYRKYSGTYNKLKSYWKDEPVKVRRVKGLLVILSIVLPWVPLILIGILSK